VQPPQKLEFYLPFSTPGHNRQSTLIFSSQTTVCGHV
jgi:hypothetical protein